jgi:hypothetical protein
MSHEHTARPDRTAPTAEARTTPRARVDASASGDRTASEGVADLMSSQWGKPEESWRSAIVQWIAYIALGIGLFIAITAR